MDEFSARPFSNEWGTDHRFPETVACPLSLLKPVIA